MNIQLSTNEWLKLPIETRNKLREIFNIPKSKGVIVESDVVKSDGTTYEDLQAITIEKMQKYLFSEVEKETKLDYISDNFPILFDTVIAKIEADKELEVKEQTPDLIQLQLEEWTASLNRLKGDAVAKDKLVYLRELVKRIFEIKIEQNETPRLPAKRGRPKKVK